MPNIISDASYFKESGKAGLACLVQLEKGQKRVLLTKSCKARSSVEAELLAGVMGAIYLQDHHSYTGDVLWYVDCAGLQGVYQEDDVRLIGTRLPGSGHIKLHHKCHKEARRSVSRKLG